MDDLSEKISSLLSDEETVKELKTLADSLGFDTSAFGRRKAAGKRGEVGRKPAGLTGIGPGYAAENHLLP